MKKEIFPFQSLTPLRYYWNLKQNLYFSFDWEIVNVYNWFQSKRKSFMAFFSDFSKFLPIVMIYKILSLDKE